MATRDQVFDEMITPMESRLGPFTRGDASAFYEDVVAVLEDFTPIQIAHAQRWYRNNWTYARWPSPAEMRKRCFEAPALKVVEPTNVEPLKPNWKLDEDATTKLLDCQLGRDAARQRWIGDLCAFVSEWHRLPTRKEAEPLKARAGRNDELIRQLETNTVVNPETGNDKPIPFGPRQELLALGRQLQDRDDRVSLAIGVTPPIHTTQEAS